jgi:hypothetical protein
MNRHVIEICCQPANPVDYLACCGLADLIARADHTARTHWRVSSPICFVIETAFNEHDIFTMLVDTLSNNSCWHPSLCDTSGEWSAVTANFTPNQGPPFSVTLDWWYETLGGKRKISEKSAWKMYAGQQTVEKITTDMIAACATLRAQVVPVKALSGLLAANTAMSGRFGFDPRSSRDALNVGYSPNDLQLPVPTYPFAELLVCFGVSSFFPSRTATAGDLDSTRGWLDRGEERSAFAYHLWSHPLPVAMARLAAACGEGTESPSLLSVRNNRKHYANLTNAKPLSNSQP